VKQSFGAFLIAVLQTSQPTELPSQVVLFVPLAHPLRSYSRLKTSALS